MLSRQMTKVIDSIKTVFDSGNCVFNPFLFGGCSLAVLNFCLPYLQVRKKKTYQRSLL